MAELMNLLMEDGSRCFAFEPEAGVWDVAAHVRGLPGAVVTKHDAFPAVGQAWMDFDFSGHTFSIEIDEMACSLYVRDPSCSDEILLQVRQAILSP